MQPEASDTFSQPGMQSADRPLIRALALRGHTRSSRLPERVEAHFLCLLKMAFATMCAPRSEGMLSKPHMCTIFTFLAAASSWYFLIVLETQGTSPAGQSPCVVPASSPQC